MTKYSFVYAHLHCIVCGKKENIHHYGPMYINFCSRACRTSYILMIIKKIK